MIHTVQFKNKNEDRDKAAECSPPTPRKNEAPRSHRLALEEDHPFREKGYNPYETVVHVKDTRDRDGGETSPKRS